MHGHIEMKYRHYFRHNKMGKREGDGKGGGIREYHINVAGS
jgi:hypothetical protein